MAIVQTAQETITDISDAYSVTLTSEAYTFPAGITAAIAGSTTTMVQAKRGASDVNATVNQASIKGLPTGLSASVNANGGKPVITFTASTSLTTKAGNVTIPVLITDGGVEITIEKVFSFALSNKGDTGAKGDKGDNITITSQSVTYQVGTSGTTKPTGTWSPDVPSVSNGQYLWTKTVVTYSDGVSTTAYGVSYKGTNGTNGSNGSSVTITSKVVEYQVSNSGTTTPSGEWKTDVPSVPAGQYLWTRTTVNYNGTNGSTVSYSVSRNGTNGADGADAITMGITTSNGTIFRNNTGSTTLTAWVRVGGKEATISDAGVATYGGRTIGTVKWYKPGETTGTAAKAITVTAAQVDSTAQYTAQLES